MDHYYLRRSENFEGVLIFTNYIIQKLTQLS